MENGVKNVNFPHWLVTQWMENGVNLLSQNHSF